MVSYSQFKILIFLCHFFLKLFVRKNLRALVLYPVELIFSSKTDPHIELFMGSTLFKSFLREVWAWGYVWYWRSNSRMSTNNLINLVPHIVKSFLLLVFNTQTRPTFPAVHCVAQCILENRLEEGGQAMSIYAISA